MSSSKSLSSGKINNVQESDVKRTVSSTFNPDRESLRYELENKSFREKKISRTKTSKSGSLKSKHRREKIYKCDHLSCKRKFITQYKLKTHKRAHKGVRPFRCDFPNCCHSFFSKEAQSNHKRKGHIVDEKRNLKFSCGHQGCSLRFKTKKQKLSHHNKLELECKEEKNILIKLISKFNKAFFSIAKCLNVNLSEVEKLSDIEDLKNTYEKTTLKLQDPDFFFFCVGDKLQFPSLNNN